MSLLLLFSFNVSRSEAQAMSFQPEEGGMPAGISVEADSINPQILRQKDDLSQVSGTNWSEPLLLFEENSTGEIHSPYVISDSYGNVHVFWSVISESPGEFDLIYYMRLDSAGWTTPVDIVAAAPARAARAAISQDDFIYLIWSGVGGISYSRAPIQEAEIVNNWSEPVHLADSNIHASVVASPSRDIYLAYPGVDQTGIIVQVLESHNLIWSSPKMVSLNSLIDTAADWVHVGVSSNGTLHVVWTEFYYPESWPPRGVFYSNSVDGGDNWSAPILIAGEGYDQLNLSVLNDNNIHVAWNGQAGVGGRYHRWSSDGGQTWSETIEVIPAGIGGTEGPPQLVGDASSTLHMLTTHFGGCAWYTSLENQRWTTPICISGEKNLIEEPAMTISEGNRLHAVFWEDRRRLWYTTKVTNAPWIPPTVMETNLIQPPQNLTATALPVSTSTISPTSLPLDQQLGGTSRFNLNPWQILVLSLSPVILLLVVIAVVGFCKKTR